MMTMIINHQKAIHLDFTNSEVTEHLNEVFR